MGKKNGISKSSAKALLKHYNKCELRDFIKCQMCDFYEEFLRIQFRKQNEKRNEKHLCDQLQKITL